MLHHSDLLCEFVNPVQFGAEIDCAVDALKRTQQLTRVGDVLATSGHARARLVCQNPQSAPALS